MTDTTTELLLPIMVRDGLPSNVIEAIRRVMAEIGGIEKLNPTQRAQRGLYAGDGDPSKGVKWAYRSIEDITEKAQELFARYGVVIVSDGSSYERRDVPTQSGGSMTETVITFHWTVYGPGGVTDCIPGSSVGEARNSGDKGTAAASTNAYKGFIMRLLAIGDPRDDGDHDDTRDEAPRQSANFSKAAPVTDDELNAAMAKLKPPQKLKVQRYAAQVLGLKVFNEPGDLSGNLLAAIVNVTEGREPDDNGAVQTEDSESVAGQPAESEADTVADPPTATVSEPTRDEAMEAALATEQFVEKAKGRGKAKEDPAPAIPKHTCDWTPTRSTCTVCAAEEPF